jgi:hypothetical protein
MSEQDKQTFDSIQRYYPMQTSDGCEMFPSQDDGTYIKCSDAQKFVDSQALEIERLREVANKTSAATKDWLEKGVYDGRILAPALADLYKYDQGETK